MNARTLVQQYRRRQRPTLKALEHQRRLYEQQTQTHKALLDEQERLTRALELFRKNP
jgi:hypothetical protein